MTVEGTSRFTFALATPKRLFHCVNAFPIRHVVCFSSLFLSLVVCQDTTDAHRKKEKKRKRGSVTQGAIKLMSRCCVGNKEKTSILFYCYWSKFLLLHKAFLNGTRRRVKDDCYVTTYWKGKQKYFVDMATTTDFDAQCHCATVN